MTSKLVKRQENFKSFRDVILPSYQAQIAAALPKHMNPERFIRVVLTGFTKTLELMDCTDLSILGCIIQSAQLGLELDGVTGQAYMVPFNNSKTGEKESQLIPGYKGYLTLAYNSDRVDSVNAKKVYEGDDFRYNYGLNQDLVHVPKFVEGKRELSHVYCVVKMKSGGHVFDVMSKEEINEHRDRYSKGANRKDSAWMKEYESMALKTVIRRTLKLVPQSPDLRMAVSLDESAEVGMKQKIDANFQVIDVPTDQKMDELNKTLEESKNKTLNQDTAEKTKTPAKQANSSDTDKTTPKVDKGTKKKETDDTGGFKGNYEKMAIDRYNKLSTLGGDSAGLLEQLTGQKRVDPTIKDTLKQRVLHVFDIQIKELTPNQQGSILKETK